MKLFYRNKNVTTKTINLPVNGRIVPLLIIAPVNRPENATGVLWMHGGGYFCGFKELVYNSRGIDLVEQFGCVVISPGYHLSLFHPYPAALEECYEALLFMKENHRQLGINIDQLMVGGESAGGGLCAALTMMARDKEEVNIAFQMPLYPMLDCFDTGSSANNHSWSWNTTLNHLAWKLYLRKDYGKPVSPYASAARGQDYSNLPAAYSFVCSEEPFYDETITYFDNLQKAGVEAKLDIYEGMYHGFDMLEPQHVTSRQAIENFRKYFAYAKENFYAFN
ncbi:MAG: alpha/beta hydrolase [Erysipelotrichaceae bacterium]|nr:alpha/beta hydrolase [Erysipelotrichaceae bacterium]